MNPPALELAGVIKDYRGLRPLRIERLTLGPRDRVALVGLDQVMAEVFVNLLTAATLPDSGEVNVFGRPTSALVDGADWLTAVDRFGIVTSRAVLLDGLTVIQNLAVPFTLDIEPPPREIEERASTLAREVDLPELVWARPVGALDAAARASVRLARALALDPAILLLEHPTADLEPSMAVGFGKRVRATVERRGVALLALTADARFAGAVANRVLTLEAATGRLKESRQGRWFDRLLG